VARGGVVVAPIAGRLTYQCSAGILGGLGLAMMVMHATHIALGMCAIFAASAMGLGWLPVIR
jgi:hypothetical protein